MEVPAKNGVLTLEYVSLPADWWGLVLTLLAPLGFAGVWWFGRNGALLERTWRFADAHRRRIAAGLVGVIAAVGLGVVGVAQASATPLPEASVFRRLDLAASLAGEPCRKTEPLRYECGAEVVEASVVSGVWGVHLCMSSAGAPKTSPVVFRGRARLGSFLKGEYDPSKEGQGSIQVLVDGRRLGQARTRPAFLRQQSVQFDTRALAGQTVNLEIQLSGAALHCFDFEVVP
jgi:hypothetical protein